MNDWHGHYVGRLDGLSPVALGLLGGRGEKWLTQSSFMTLQELNKVVGLEAAEQIVEIMSRDLDLTLGEGWAMPGQPKMVTRPPF